MTPQLPPSQMELTLQTNWVYFFTSIVTEGKLKVIKPEGLAVLLVLKTIASWADGKARIGQDRLADLVGFKQNVKKLRKVLAVLEQEKYISTFRKTKNSRTEYTIRDLVVAKDTEGNEEELAVDYYPKELAEIRRRLADYARTRDEHYLPQQVIVLQQIQYVTNIDNSFKIDADNNSTVIVGNLDSILEDRRISMANKQKLFQAVMDIPNKESK